MIEIDASTLRRISDIHAVYRMFDADGRLLYVGVTANLGARLGSHAEKRWFPLVDMIRLEWFATRSAALLAERRAIQSERPRLNIAGTRGPRLPSVPRVPKVPKPKLVLPLPGGPVTLREAITAGVLRGTVESVRRASTRSDSFPLATGRRMNAKLYNVGDLQAWQAGRAKVSV